MWVIQSTLLVLSNGTFAVVVARSCRKPVCANCNGKVHHEQPVFLVAVPSHRVPTWAIRTGSMKASPISTVCPTRCHTVIFLFLFLPFSPCLFHLSIPLSVPHHSFSSGVLIHPLILPFSIYPPFSAPDSCFPSQRLLSSPLVAHTTAGQQNG